MWHLATIEKRLSSIEYKSPQQKTIEKDSTAMNTITYSQRFLPHELSTKYYAKNEILNSTLLWACGRKIGLCNARYIMRYTQEQISTALVLLKTSPIGRRQ